MITFRPIIGTLVGLPLAFSSCVAKNAVEYTAKTATIINKSDFNTDVFQKTTKLASKATTEIASQLPIKSATQMNSRTALSAEDLDRAIETLAQGMGKKASQCVLIGKGKVFLEMGEKYGVNPVSIMAIAMQESARGTSAAARTKNNIGGLIGRKGQIKFDSVDSCIESMAKLLQKHIKNGRTTISALGKSGKYCAKSHSREWVKNCNFYIQKIESQKATQQ